MRAARASFPLARAVDATAMNRLQTAFRLAHPAFRLASHRIVRRFTLDPRDDALWGMVTAGDLQDADGRPLPVGTHLSAHPGEPVVVQGRGTVVAVRGPQSSVEVRGVAGDVIEPASAVRVALILAAAADGSLQIGEETVAVVAGQIALLPADVAIRGVALDWCLIALPSQL